MRTTTQSPTEKLARALAEILDNQLTWSNLSAEQRGRLTRAANAAELAVELIRGAEVRDRVTI